MDDLLMDKLDKKNLELFKFILFSEDGVSFSQIKKKFSLSQPTCYRYINQLFIDVQKCFDSDSNINLDVKSDHIYKITFDKNVGVNFYIDKLRVFYIQQNTTFIVLHSLIRNKYVSIEQLAYDVNLSVPTIYKKIANINKLARKLDVQLSVNSKFGNITGSEIGVRFFYYLFFWNIYHTVDLTYLNDFKIKDFFLSTSLENRLCCSQKVKLKLIQKINSKRISNKNTVSLTKDFQKDIEPFLLHDLNNRTFQLSSNQNNDEHLYFSFIIRFAIPELDSFSHKEKIFHQFKNSKNRIGNLLNTFLADYSRKFNFKFSYESYIDTYYLLLIRFIYIKHFNYDIYSLDYNYPKLQQYSLQNRHYLSMIEKIKGFLVSECKILKINFLNFNKSSIDTLLAILYFCYITNKKIEPVKLYVSYSKNLYTIPTIKNFLKKFYNTNTIKFTDTIAETDILISDTYEGSIENIQHFYFDSEFNNETWFNLIEFINHYINTHNSFYLPNNKYHDDNSSFMP
ncbi:helix-turn-helix domain-containing protein [Enterococcus durans]|uniref:helix-turn-helix domain-containing protein n=1 Tax=Enterococcus durans TaxID=53345 RepID=UPI0032E3907E